MPITDRALDERFAPVFARIADGALDRERERRLPFDEVALLKASGFTGLRVPAEFGGLDATLPQTFRLLAALAAADSHLPQAFRGHVAFVEDRRYAPPSPERDAWLRRAAAGELVGNAFTEIGSVVVGTTATRLEVDPDADGDGRGAEHDADPDPGGYRITGTKYYTTGSIFAEWIEATTVLPDGTDVHAVVSTGPESVRIDDDWSGFGQRLTGSGTTTFDGAPVAAAHVTPFARRFPTETATYQLVLVAVQAGIARAIVRDTAALLAGRSRTYSQGNTDVARNDPQLLAVVGELEANAFAAEAVLDRAARALQSAFDGWGDADADARAALRRDAELASASAQLVTNRLALASATSLFDALGASGTSQTTLLDRHWRNARTVASHNPQVFKARVLGDAAVNGTDPYYEWAIGVPASAGAAAS